MNEKDPLDSLLGSWQPGAEAPGDFQKSVWTRIASHAGTGSGALKVFPWARRALLASAAAVVLGFSLGFLTSNKGADVEQEAYFSRINPLTRVQ